MRRYMHQYELVRFDRFLTETLAFSVIYWFKDLQQNLTVMITAIINLNK